MSFVVNDACKFTVKIMNDADIVWVLLSFVVVVACEVVFLCCVFGFMLVGSRALQPWLACVRSGYLGQTLAIEAPCPLFFIF